jgi:hypothetical protein
LTLIDDGAPRGESFHVGRRAGRARSQTGAKKCCSNFKAIVSSMAGTETSLRRKDGIPSPENFASYSEYYRIDSLAPVFHHLNRREPTVWRK